MKRQYEFPIKIGLLLVIWLLWWWAIVASLPPMLNLGIIIGGIVLIFPFIWISRMLLDRNPTPGRAVWATTFVHVGLGILLGVPIVRAAVTYQDWRGWLLPVPAELGRLLVLLSAVAFALTVANLALKGLGAPFYLALSQKVATDWMYAWTRNPMGLAGIALLASLGIRYQSALFLAWGMLLVTPAFLFFIKVFEERELELRFGASYLEYRARTPMLFPRKPKKKSEARG